MPNKPGIVEQASESYKDIFVAPRVANALLEYSGTPPVGSLVSATQDVPALPIPPLPPAVQSSATEPSPLRDLHRKALEKHNSLEGYIFRMRRREVVAGKKMPEELMICKFRREPFSVYFKWLGEEGKGREVAYSKNQYDGLIHTLMAPNDLLFLGGKVFKVAPDSVLVKSKSRYPITSAGLGNLIENYGRLVTAVEKGDPNEGTAKYLGVKRIPEFEYDMALVVQTLPAGSDPLLPKGGQRFWYFDSTNHLPGLIVARDEAGQEVEYYCHDRLMPARLSDDDFNPDKLWKK